jgi:hypothetical protein
MAADIGLRLDRGRMYLTKGREFFCTLQLTQKGTGLPVSWPSGRLYFQFDDIDSTQWQLDIAGAVASTTVSSTLVDLIQPYAKWQLVFTATGDSLGGVPVGLGVAVVQS